MPDLSGKTPASTFRSLLTLNNTSGGLDGVLRLVEDGAGLQTPLQLSTNHIAFHGAVWPSTGSSTGSFLRVSSTANTLEWHAITSSDITTILGYVPANSTNGSFSSALSIKSATVDTQQTAVTDTSVQTVYTFKTTTGGTVKFLCQVQDTSSNAIHSEEILVVTDGSTLDMTGFGVVVTQNPLGNFDVVMSGSNVNLTFQAASQSTKKVTIVATFVTT